MDKTTTIEVGYNQFTRYYTDKIPLEDIDGMAKHIDLLPTTWTTGKIQDHGTKTISDGDINPARDCRIKWIDDKKVREYVWNEFLRANVDVDFQFDITNLENIQYTRYDPGMHYNWHNDTMRGNMGGDTPMIRKLSMTLVLNDEFEGGEFEIGENQGWIDDEGNYSMKLKTYRMDLRKGDILVFPSNLEHRVNPVTTGQRNVLVAWAWGPLFK